MAGRVVGARPPGPGRPRHRRRVAPAGSAPAGLLEPRRYDLPRGETERRRSSERQLRAAARAWHVVRRRNARATSRRIAWQRRPWPAGSFDGPDGPPNEPSEPRGDLSHARIGLTPRAVACPAGGSSLRRMLTACTPMRLGRQGAQAHPGAGRQRAGTANQAAAGRRAGQGAGAGLAVAEAAGPRPSYGSVTEIAEA